MVNRVFGGRVVAKQDPFHVITRFTEKIKKPQFRHWLSSELSKALYVDGAGELRQPQQMSKLLEEACANVSASDLNCSQDEWMGTLKSNIDQINRGDLFVTKNSYMEGDHSIKVVSTSQLESFHAKLKNLLDRNVSVTVGMRILDVCILQHNIEMGAKFRRNPPITNVNLLKVCESAILSHGVLPTSKEQEYVLNLFSAPDVASTHHVSASLSGEMARWQALFLNTQVNATAVEQQLLKTSKSSRMNLKTLFGTSNRANIYAKTFFSALRIDPEYEDESFLHHHEYILLKDIRRCQRFHGDNLKWESDAFVSTVLFNISVEKVPSQHLQLRKKSFFAIAKHAAEMDRESVANVRPEADLFAFNTKKPVKNKSVSCSPAERYLMEELFVLFYDSKWLSKRKKQFVVLYDFAASICSDICPRTESFLETRWSSMRQERYRADRSLKLRIKILHPNNVMSSSN